MKQYFATQTKQALVNFPFTYRLVHKEFIYAIARIKKAAALAHGATGDMDGDIVAAIGKACDEIISGSLDDQFPVGAFQGGAGTSINMNVNEVIASRAEELLGEQGKKLTVHPNDHVNKAQSTNDVNPSALKLACVLMIEDLVKTLSGVLAAFENKAEEFKHISKLGRTHIQDAVPITLGSEFASWAAVIKRDIQRIQAVLPYMHELNLGGTAVGNAINATPAYQKEVYKKLKEITHIDVKPADNLMSQTSSQTDFCMLSQALVLLTLDCSKIASDIRLLSSGPRGGLGEITLAELQPGSSIMPGKVNPVLPESVNQLYFLVSGNDATIGHAAHASQLELGVMFPVLADRLLESLQLTKEVLSNFSKACVASIKANEANCKMNLEKSSAYATLLTPILGYDIVSLAVKESIKSGKSIREVIVNDKKLMSEVDFEKAITIAEV